MIGRLSIASLALGEFGARDSTVRHLRMASILVALATPLVTGAVARADQGGVSFWLPGIYASLAAVPPSPGFSLPSTFYFYTGNANGNREFPVGNLIAAGLDADFAGLLLAPTWVPETTVAGRSTGVHHDGHRRQ